MTPIEIGTMESFNVGAGMAIPGVRSYREIGKDL